MKAIEKPSRHNDWYEEARLRRVRSFHDDASGKIAALGNTVDPGDRIFGFATGTGEGKKFVDPVEDQLEAGNIEAEGAGRVMILAMNIGEKYDFSILTAVAIGERIGGCSALAARG